MQSLVHGALFVSTGSVRTGGGDGVDGEADLFAPLFDVLGLILSREPEGLWLSCKYLTITHETLVIHAVDRLQGMPGDCGQLHANPVPLERQRGHAVRASASSTAIPRPLGTIE